MAAVLYDMNSTMLHFLSSFENDILVNMRERQYMNRMSDNAHIRLLYGNGIGIIDITIGQSAIMQDMMRAGLLEAR